MKIIKKIKEYVVFTLNNMIKLFNGVRKERLMNLENIKNNKEYLKLNNEI